MINLKQLGEVGAQAYLIYNSARVNALEKPKEDKYEEIKGDLSIAWNLRAYLQYQNLHEKLTKLKEICDDYATSNLTKYIDEFNEFGYGEAWDPFENIQYLFTGDWTCLPETLESYAHLKNLTVYFSQIAKVKRERFEQTFGGQLSIISPGQSEGSDFDVVAIADVPPDKLNEMKANQEIAEIETDYCLDGYNVFYAKVTKALPIYKANNDLVGYAEFILSFIAK